MARQGISIKLKVKALKANRSSYYLHFYNPLQLPCGRAGQASNQKRHREYLSIYIHSKARNQTERDHNAKMKVLAETVYSKRILEIQEGNYGISKTNKVNISFAVYYLELIEKKLESTSKNNASSWKSAFVHWRKFTSNDLKLREIDESILNAFKDFLLFKSLSRKGKKLSVNAASKYFDKIKSALHEAFRLKLILVNPAMNVSSIKVEESKKEYLTKDEIQSLFATPPNGPRLPSGS